jgi:hypothetical protein
MRSSFANILFLVVLCLCLWHYARRAAAWLAHRRRVRQEGLLLRSLTDLDEFTTVQSTASMGRGVFATRTIPAMTLLGVYPGKRVRRASFEEKKVLVAGARQYAYLLSEGWVLDPTDASGAPPDENDARLALLNEPPPDAACNVAPLRTENNIWFLTICEIPAGEQLLISYGPHFKRDYSSEMDSTDGKIILSDETVDRIRAVGHDHPCLRAGIQHLLQE